MEEKRKAVGYCRYSSDNQREESITAQKRFIIQFAAQNAFEIEDWYVDKAKTGKNFNREEAQRLLDDAKNHKITTVIVHKLDRFSRNVAQTQIYIEKLKKWGVELISVSEKFDNSPSGKMMQVIVSSYNEYYINNLSLETKKGLKENALKQEFNGGIPCLGYDIVDKHYVINEDEAIIVKLIFTMYSQGYGYNQIIKELNSKGYKTKKGNVFGKSSLYGILRNEKYKGTYIYNEHCPRKFWDGRNSHRKNDEEDVIRIEGGCPAIVSKELWEKVNSINKTNRINTNAKHEYLLGGLLYCSYCGSKLYGNHRNSRSDRGDYLTYRCSKKDRQCNCNLKEINAKKLEDWVWKEIFDKFWDSDSIFDEVQKEVNKKLSEKLNNDTEYKDRIQRIEEYRKVQKGLINALGEMGGSTSVAQQIKKYDEMIEDLNKKIRLHEELISCSYVSLDTVKYRLMNLKKLATNPSCVGQLKLVLAQIIDRIEIGNETIKITYKLTFDGKSGVSYMLDNSVSRNLALPSRSGKNWAKILA